MNDMQPFPFRLVGVASRVGNLVPIDEWAEQARIPHRYKANEILSGPEITKVLGIVSKSWEVSRFRDFEVVRSTAMSALKSGGVPPAEVDLAIVVSCTPYEIMLDQDAFRLLKGLGIRDEVAPLQLGAGCGGVARAAKLMARTTARKVLVVAYNLASPMLWVDGKEINPHYLNNADHPFKETLWASLAIFSDGVAAAVFERTDDLGLCLYSRDCQSFGDAPGFDSTLVTFGGGGALNPPGSAHCLEQSCFGMDGDRVRDYYLTGMMLNHKTLKAERPRFAEELKRLYVHQSSPALVQGFIERSGLNAELVATEVATHGNMVAASTLRLFHEDVARGYVRSGDEVCFSVVGAGPERGVVLCRVETREVISL